MILSKDARLNKYAAVHMLKSKMCKDYQERQNVICEVKLKYCLFNI